MFTLQQDGDRYTILTLIYGLLFKACTARKTVITSLIAFLRSMTIRNTAEYLKQLSHEMAQTW